MLLVSGKVEGCSLQTFEDATGLKLMDANGIKDELPPITTFLNRLLALTIDLQSVLFTAFEQLLDARIEGAIASGVYDVGLETLRAESFVVTDRRTIYTHPATGAETRLLTITERERNRPVTLDEALDRLADPPRRAAGQRALGPRRRAGPGAEPHARRWRDRAPRAADPADGEPQPSAEDDGGEPLAGGGPPCIILKQLQIMLFGMGIIAQVVLRLGQTPIHLGILRVQNHRGLEARKRCLPVFSLQVVAAHLNVFGSNLLVGGFLDDEEFSLLSALLIVVPRFR